VEYFKGTKKSTSGVRGMECKSRFYQNLTHVAKDSPRCNLYVCVCTLAQSHRVAFLQGKRV